MIHKRLLILAASFSGFAACMLPSARGAVILSLVPESVAPVQAGAVAPIDLYLTGQRTQVIASIELTLTTPAGGASYVAQAPDTQGFAEAPTLTNYLSFATDGSLLDDPSLGFAAAPGVDGIPTGSDSLLLGTLWLQTVPSVAASYPVNFVSVELLDPNPGDAAIAVQTLGTTIIAGVPEPSFLALLSVGLLMFCRPTLFQQAIVPRTAAGE